MSVTDGIWGLGMDDEALASTPPVRLAYSHNHLMCYQSLQTGQMDTIKHKETN